MSSFLGSHILSDFVPYARRIPPNIIVVGIDDSYHSFRALDWALGHFFKYPSQSPYNLVLVHAEPYTFKCTHLVAPDRKHDMLAIKKILDQKTTSLLQKAYEFCNSKSVDVFESEIMQCEPGLAICCIAGKYNASAIIVGRRGDGTNQRSVAVDKVKDFCQKHSTSGMIVESPNEEQLQNKEYETNEMIKVEVVKKTQDLGDISLKRSFPTDPCESPMEVEKRRKLGLAMVEVCNW